MQTWNSLAAPLSASQTSQPWLRTCFGEPRHTMNLSWLPSLAQAEMYHAKSSLTSAIPFFGDHTHADFVHGRHHFKRYRSSPWAVSGCTSQFDSSSFPTYHPPPNESSSGPETNRRVPMTRSMDDWGVVEMASGGCMSANHGFGSLFLTTS